MSEPKDGEMVVVWFSCGAASAVAAWLAVRIYGDRCALRIVNNPIAEEDEDNRRFLEDVQEWIGWPIERAVNRKYPSCSCVDVWARKRYMSGINGAPCTGELKKEARYQWEEANCGKNQRPAHIIMGFTAEEKKRHNNFVRGERSGLIPLLIDGGLTKDDCARLLVQHGLRLPRAYGMGYPNANCIGCVKATSPTYWNHVRKVHPDVFTQRASQSRELGVRLCKVKGDRVFLDELDPKAMGRPMKSLPAFDCGIYCEEVNEHLKDQ